MGYIEEINVAVRKSSDILEVRGPLWVKMGSKGQERLDQWGSSFPVRLRLPQHPSRTRSI